MSHSDHDFSSAMFFYQILDRFRRLTQGVTFINHRDDFACLEHFFEDEQIFFGCFGYSHETNLLITEL